MFKNTIWRKINEFSRKIKSRGSFGNKTTTVTTATHYATATEFYIGVSSEKPVTIYLPAAAADGKIIIIKAEMKPPMGSRKVSIETTDGSTIDGYSEASINVSHGKMTLIRNRNNWFIIS
jgi:hypothetical protein